MIGYLVVALGVIITDILTKQWALAACTDKLVINKFVACHLAFNRGVSWSMFHSDDTSMFVMVSLLVGLVIIFFAWYTYQQWREHQTIWAEVLVLSGACANMIDRLWHGAVIDFIMLEYKQYVFPLFNFADSAIVCGVIGIIVMNMQREK